MGSTGNGVKAGVLAGLIYGVVLAVLSYSEIIAEKATIIDRLGLSLPANSPINPEQAFEIAVLFAPVFAAAGGVIGGIIVGAVYGRLFERIPGTNAVMKSLIVGIVLWVLLSVIGDSGQLQYGLVVYGGNVAVGLVSALLFGFLLGFFYRRFTRPRVSDPAMQGL